MKISRAKVEELAKRSHAKCRGIGIVGYRPGTEGQAIVLCPCVFRNLRRRGVNINDKTAIAKHLAPDPPKETLPEPAPTAPASGFPPGWPYDKDVRPGPIKAERG